MIKKILHALKESDISVYLIYYEVLEQYEEYYCKKKLDCVRNVASEFADVTVYVDKVLENSKYRGLRNVKIYPEMDEKTIVSLLQEAKKDAVYSLNPFYELAKAEETESYPMEEKLDVKEMVKHFLSFRDGIEETQQLFLSTLELFGKQKTVRIINSNGIDVSYRYSSLEGEYVVTCTEQKNVDIWDRFQCSNEDYVSVIEDIEKNFRIATERSLAKKEPKSGEYEVILPYQYIKIIFSYLVDNTDTSRVYPKYSCYGKEYRIQKEYEVKDKLNLYLTSSVPYNFEGIRLKDTCIIENGVVKNVHGATRFCRYLDVPPIGRFDGIRITHDGLGEELESEGCFVIESLSLLQIDCFTSEYYGEIRCGYIRTGNTKEYVTGGSIHGNLLESINELVFSTEETKRWGYQGPRNMRLSHCKISGKEEY